MTEYDWQIGHHCQYWQDTVLLEVEYEDGSKERGEACSFSWGPNCWDDPYSPSIEIVRWRRLRD